ncbi:AI-2E family transporter [Mammaliicoccus sp. Dog046]|uniref:AI-2E family transporter n=1 Tax=Mammaliicoccus sp. Dog046 TaxID=3034233 RepID=UPI002B256892|nr:AI-2E family transporter [Mammaliicoccus sp. Dog046]WQK86701.1 AI-2E family transporter [Mammaliicoccus sp. Dog046]
MKFFGGRDIYFILGLLILIGLTIFIFQNVSFIFKPLVTVTTTLIGPIIVAFIAFYLFNPIINFMEKLNVPRLWGIIILLLAIIGAMTLVVTLLIPVVQEQVQSLTKNLPTYVHEFSLKIEEFSQNSFVADYITQAQNWLQQNFSDIPKKISNSVGDFGNKFHSFVSTITHVVVVIITFPFVLFFLLKDGERFRNYIISLMPPKFRKDTHDLIDKMNVQVGSYIQGQMIVALCIGILLFIGYSIIGLDYALTLASIAAVTSVVPYLGPIIAISPAIVLAAIDSPFMLLKLAIVWAAVQFLEGHFISPNIMGKTMQIHPLTIIFVLLCAGNLVGILGVILGIPTYAILKVIVSHLFTLFKRRYNKYYQDEAGPYEFDDDEIINEKV